jgi:hypothetical protein
MILSENQIELLLHQKPITDEWPWVTRDESVIDMHWKDVLSEICRDLNLLEKSEFGHYGSGYASYVDSWLYRDTEEFRFHPGNCFWGLVILYSRLSPFYVIGEGKRTWHDKGGSSYLPCFEFVDQLTQNCVFSLSQDVEAILGNRGLRRLRKDQVSGTLDAKFQVPTILADPPLRHFDAIYYWED